MNGVKIGIGIIIGTGTEIMTITGIETTGTEIMTITGITTGTEIMIITDIMTGTGIMTITDIETTGTGIAGADTKNL